MNAVAIGPLVFSNARFQAVLAIFVFLAVVELIAWRWPRHAQDARPWSILALLSWIGAARLGFVGAEWDSFAAAPLDVLALWQGGFDPLAGLAGFGVVTLLGTLRRPSVAAPLLAAAACAGIAVAGARLALPDEASGRLPEIALPDLSGRPVPLTDAEGRPVVINLWASWCPPCRREMPMMMEVATARDDAAVRFANQRERAATISDFLRRQGLASDAVLRDPDGRLMERFDLLGLPSTLFFDAEGRLEAVHTGEISRAQLNARIDDLTRETP
ncbi:TlpA disulfide reductase family protein [Tranquillimonas alkanivorans]|uniref:Thiol-disulfide isomerase or thioredoxin n=1 Tax=Tranquillimonas alkanivorans TaxID=441119 RepID=A0A1I5UCS8_9RHOB|nr:TlpA disulfide reductase family protein [Tranquillimonas alkanivorans]SFP93090.1 Thiol-disulfide isomerase or thioredoxin [Tranquillimonas alkanivorans]